MDAKNHHLIVSEYMYKNGWFHSCGREKLKSTVPSPVGVRIINADIFKDL